VIFSERNARSANHMTGRTYEQQSDSKRVIGDLCLSKPGENRRTAVKPQDVGEHGRNIHTYMIYNE
jgi:hypothetical protein